MAVQSGRHQDGAKAAVGDRGAAAGSSSSSAQQSPATVQYAPGSRPESPALDGKSKEWSQKSWKEKVLFLGFGYAIQDKKDRASREEQRKLASAKTKADAGKAGAGLV